MIYKSIHNKTLIYIQHECGFNLFTKFEKDGTVTKVKDSISNYKDYERILFIRNPYKRIECFYQNKFACLNTYSQKCHNRIKKYINKDLKNTTLNDIINAMRKGYTDSHIFPINICRDYNKVLKYENATDIKYIEDKFKIKIPFDTDAINISFEWTLEMRKIINRKYSKDFHLFNYLMLPILYIENRKIFQNWSSKTYEHKYNKILENNNFKVLDIGDNSINTININDHTHAIFGWHGISINKYYNETKHIYYKKYVESLETSDEVNLKIDKLLKIQHKAVIVQDMHGGDYYGGLNNFCKYMKNNNFEYIITPYLKTSQIDYIRDNCSFLKIFHLPHFIDETIFKNWNCCNKYDILLFGNDDVKYYPFRHRVINLILKHKDKLRVGHIPRHRNYFKHNKKISNDNLSKNINKSHLTLCTGSKYDFLLGKYFETSMSGGVVVGNMPEDGKSIWNDNYIQINDQMTDDDILQTILISIRDPNRLNDIKNNMLSQMESYHLSKYADKLLSFFV